MNPDAGCVCLHLHLLSIAPGFVYVFWVCVWNDQNDESILYNRMSGAFKLDAYDIVICAIVTQWHRFLSEINIWLLF